MKLPDLQRSPQAKRIANRGASGKKMRADGQNFRLKAEKLVAGVDETGAGQHHGCGAIAI